MKKEAEVNIVTLYYRKAENIPETGDQEETAKIAVRTAAAGIAVLLLLAVRKKKRLAPGRSWRWPDIACGSEVPGMPGN